jgi:hypothetical protein
MQFVSRVVWSKPLAQQVGASAWIRYRTELSQVIAVVQQAEHKRGNGTGLWGHIRLVRRGTYQ